MKTLLNSFEKIIIKVLLVLMGITIIISTFDLGYKLVEELISPPFLLFDICEFAADIWLFLYGSHWP